MERIVIVSVLALASALLSVVTGAPAQAAESTRTIFYGPFTVPAGTMDQPGELSRLRLAVGRPCSDCYITSFSPDLVEPDGTRATLGEDGLMLHHAVWTSQWRADATCSGSWLGLAGERFFASGDERTEIGFPSGYGYRVRWYDSWNLLVDLMNHRGTDRTVYLKLTVTTRPAWEALKPLKPVWLDIDQCGDSEYPIPAGFSDTHADWSVTVPGDLVAMIGHVHGHGVFVEATNESRGGASLCRSLATLDPTNVHAVLDMTTCSGQLGRLRYGDRVRLHSHYNSSHAADDVMGIMLGWVHRR